MSSAKKIRRSPSDYSSMSQNKPKYPQPYEKNNKIHKQSSSSTTTSHHDKLSKYSSSSLPSSSRPLPPPPPPSSSSSTAPTPSPLITPSLSTLSKSLLKYTDTTSHFRLLIICSLFSSTPIEISNIRTSIGYNTTMNDDDLTHDPTDTSIDISSSSSTPTIGLTDYEISFLRLIDKITTGSIIKIDSTGTKVKFYPGMLQGGSVLKFDHHCPPSRGIGYYLEFLILLSPFCKNPLEIDFHGITNTNEDISIDIIRIISIPMIGKIFSLSPDELPKLQVIKRGLYPVGEGIVNYNSPIWREGLSSIHKTNIGLVKRIRGLSYTINSNPSLSIRAMESGKGVFNNILSDIFIYNDHYKGKEASEGSKGYGMMMVAETTEGAIYGSEYIMDERERRKEKREREKRKGEIERKEKEKQKQRENDESDGDDHTVDISGQDIDIGPEDIGISVANTLLNEISYGGMVDSSHQTSILLLMLLTPIGNVSKIRLGMLTEYSLQSLRLFFDFFKIKFKLKGEITEDMENKDITFKTVVASCVGSGYKNFARKALA